MKNLRVAILLIGVILSTASQSFAFGESTGKGLWAWSDILDALANDHSVDTGVARGTLKILLIEKPFNLQLLLNSKGQACRTKYVCDAMSDDFFRILVQAALDEKEWNYRQEQQSWTRWIAVLSAILAFGALWMSWLGYRHTKGR